jgi:SAM-dependent methyltransferase
MTQPITSEDWIERGKRWASHVAGMEAMLAPVDEPLIRALSLDRPYRIADVGCGGGGTSLEVLRRAPEGSVVRGFDVSPPLIEVAQRRSSDVVFELADVSKVVPGTPFDRLTSRFGIMFFPDAEVAFGNLAKWLAPGGKFAFAAWGPLNENPWMTVVKDAVAGVVEVPKSDPDAPGPFRYAKAEVLAGLLAHAGFADVRVDDWKGTLRPGGGLPPDVAAKFSIQTMSTFHDLLQEAGGPALEDAGIALAARYAEYVEDGVVQLGACVHIFSGRLG